jgi:hypothetical protein
LMRLHVEALFTLDDGQGGGGLGANRAGHGPRTAL